MGSSKKKAPKSVAKKAPTKKPRGATSRPPARATPPVEMAPSRPQHTPNYPPDGIGEPHDARVPVRDIRTQTEATWIDDVSQTQLMRGAPVFVRWGLGVYKLGLLTNMSPGPLNGFHGRYGVRMLKVNERGSYVAEFGPTELEVDADQVSRVYMDRDWESIGDHEDVAENDARMSRGPATDGAHGDRDQPNIAAGKSGGREVPWSGELSDEQAVEVCNHILGDKPITALLLRTFARWGLDKVDIARSQVVPSVDGYNPTSLGAGVTITNTPGGSTITGVQGGAVGREVTIEPKIGAGVRVIGDDPERPDLWHRAVVVDVKTKGRGRNTKRVVVMRVLDEDTTVGKVVDELLLDMGTRWRIDPTAIEPTSRAAERDVAPAAEPRDVIPTPTQPSSTSTRDVAPSSRLPPGVPNVGDLISVRTGGSWEVVSVTGYDALAKVVTFAAHDGVMGNAKMSEKDRTWRELSNAERARHQKSTGAAAVRTHDEKTPEQIARDAEKERAKIDDDANKAARKVEKHKPTPVERAVADAKAIDHAAVMPKTGHVVCIKALGNWTPTKVVKIRDVDKFEVLGGLALTVADHGTAWIHVHEVPRAEVSDVRVPDDEYLKDMNATPRDVGSPMSSKPIAPQPLTLNQRNQAEAKRLGIPLWKYVEQQRAENEPAPTADELESARVRSAAILAAMSGPSATPIQDANADAYYEGPDEEELALATPREKERLASSTSDPWVEDDATPPITSESDAIAEESMPWD